jgi:hypothetical protein
MNRTFRDNAGGTWLITINSRAISNVLAEMNIDLTSDAAIRRLSEGLTTAKYVGLLWVLLCDECEERGIGGRDFAKLFDDDVVNDSSRALCDALAMHRKVARHQKQKDRKQKKKGKV